MHITSFSPAPAPIPLPQLGKHLRDSVGARPALVSYHDGGARIELSGRTLENWIAKTANLLAEELFDPADASIWIELGGGGEPDAPVAAASLWKQLVVVLAASAAGAQVTLLSPGAEEARAHLMAMAPTAATKREPEPTETVLVTHADARRAVPAQVPPPELTFRVALGDLERTFAGPMNDGDIDYAAEVLSQPDVQLNEPREQARELRVLLSTGELVSVPELPSPGPVAARLITSADPGVAIVEAIGALAHGCRAVLAPGAAPERIARISAAENLG